MVLSVSSFGDNVQIPGAAAEAYLPDQLIAGNLKIVTDKVTITGGAALKRGTVLGLASLGAIAASPGIAFASGSVIVAALPAAGDTVTIGGTVITFVAANPVGNQVVIGATTAATAQNLLAFLLSSSDTNLIKFAYSLSGSTVTTTAAAPGTGGNALTLATSNGTAFTVSGATLTGGTANTGNATVGTISAGKSIRPGNYTAVCASATTANVYDPAGANLGLLTFGTQFTDAQISFKITAGGTPCVAGDTFVLTAAPGSGGYKMAVSTATDGSATPSAILVDDVDATVADQQNCGIYIMGEFNINALTLGAGMTIAGIKPVLRPLGIYLKDAVTAADPS